MNRLISVVALLGLLASCQSDQTSDMITFRISQEVLNPVDHRIFGQFLEKPSWGGESGPEAALDPDNNTLQPGVFEKLDSLNIPVLRFPGGTDVDHMDWRDMISQVPGRTGQRPLSIGHRGDTITNFFGYDEALQLAEKLGSEVMLVVNFGQAYYGEKSIEAAALDVAALVAYCNAEVGASLPSGMYDWPALRAANGHPEPYEVRYVQIANEPWVLDRRLKLQGDISDSLRHHFFHIHQQYIAQIRQIDPDIGIIVDGNVEELSAHIQEALGDDVQYVAYHTYYPWQLDYFEQDGQSVSPDTLTREQIWNAWVAFPQMDQQGNAVLDNKIYANALSAGYPVAVTEWNWNGWWSGRLQEQGVLDSRLAQGLGAAGFLHAFMRQGDNIKLACQSMVLGNSWGITGIRVDPEQSFAPHYFPTGRITGFYANHHGDQLLHLESANLPVYQQPYTLNELSAPGQVNLIDALATKSEDKLYFHAINRSMDQDLTVELDVSAFSVEQATHYYLTGPVEPNDHLYIEAHQATFPISGGMDNLVLPARSVSVVEFELTKDN
ncbi:MAG: hypothetical protein ACNS62_14555 [Candidatus Cyclobacteriaceae bacterium M3_2C_046]